MSELQDQQRPTIWQPFRVYIVINCDETAIEKARELRDVLKAVIPKDVYVTAAKIEVEIE